MTLDSRTRTLLAAKVKSRAKWHAALTFHGGGNEYLMSSASWESGWDAYEARETCHFVFYLMLKYVIFEQCYSFLG